jgi:hypothetical protein
LAPLLSPNPCPFPYWSDQVPTLSDWFLYLKPIPHAWLTHCPDDGDSKHLWNISKLLPNYTVQQPRRQPYSSSPHENLKSHTLILLFHFFNTFYFA